MRIRPRPHCSVQPIPTWLSRPAALGVVIVAIALTPATVVEAAGPPCDRYPKEEQARCEQIWKQLNAEDEVKIARFGLEQLARREKGLITPEQHLAENFAFIQQSTAKRLEQLAERMRPP